MRWMLVTLLVLPTAAIAGNDCPSGFEQFLEKFQADRVFQQAHIKDPLKYTFLDYQAQPEPATHSKWLGKPEVARLKNALFPSPAAQKTLGLSIRKIADLSSHQKRVQLAKPDTGYQLDYYFDRTAACWTLTAYSDLSM